MTIYNHYIVIGAKITVKFTAYPATIPVNVCLSPNDDGTIVPASFTALAEQGAAVSGVVSASGDAPVILNYFWSMKKLMVRTLLQTSCVGMYLQILPRRHVTIIVQSSDALTSTVVVAYVEISFIAQFTELRDIGGS